MSVSEYFDTMDYGPAPESDTEARAWLKTHAKGFGHYINGGFTYLITNDIQWDIRAGAGLNDAAEDYFIGTGLSIRFR